MNKNRRCWLFAQKAEEELERDKSANFGVESDGYASKIVNPDTDATRFDAPNVRFAASDHQRKFLLRETLSLPALPNRIAQSDPFLIDVHV